mmetsp:Transcript_10506/g.17615  ORF Transcript_10506/g.17615 Transcript_10506/m.17615 type:complete len:568 (-) Transcript_10506:33-1736(-)
MLILTQTGFHHEVPLGLISRIDKYLITPWDGKDMYSQVNKFNEFNHLDILTKDNRVYKLFFATGDKELCTKVSKLLNTISFVDRSQGLSLSVYQHTFPFKFALDINENNWMDFRDGWYVYTDIRAEAKRQGIDFEDPNCRFQLFDNGNYKLCRTYPRYLVMPRGMDQASIIECSRFRTQNRLPTLSYFFRGTACSIWRSSQCMNGIMNRRSPEDEKMIEEIGKTSITPTTVVHNSRVMIYDARPYLNAQANKLKHGGFEGKKFYRNAEVEFCDIDNIHKVTKCFRKLEKAVNSHSSFESQASFGAEVEQTDYFKMIQRIVKAANMTVDQILNKQTSVLVHCSDGWDRTAQMSSLAQQMLDPFFRTIEGLIILVNKDWLSFGHQFHLRFGLFDRNHKEEQRSPVFIQYLDCVRIFIEHYPTHFEYNKQLLLFIAENVMSNKFGTFLGNCEQDRDLLKLRNRTQSIWTKVYLDIKSYRNPKYDAKGTQAPIDQFPMNSPFMNNQVWRELFFKWNDLEAKESENELRSLKETKESDELLKSKDQLKDLIQFQKQIESIQPKLSAQSYNFY